MNDATDALVYFNLNDVLGVVRLLGSLVARLLGAYVALLLGRCASR